MTDDDKALVAELRINDKEIYLPVLGKCADRIEQLGREKAVVSDLWEQQKKIALDYLADCNKTADRIEALSAENKRLREANSFLRRGLYGLMDSDDADSIATTIEAGGIVDWDKYPPSARAASKGAGLNK